MLSADIQNVLKQQPLGLLFDIDGTLSKLAPTPEEAHLYPGVAELLKQAMQVAQVGIVTGRGITDGARMVDLEGLTYVGTHGLEWSEGLPTTHEVKLVPEAIAYIEPGKYLLDLVEERLAEFPGVIVQRKKVGGTVHYRLARDPEETRVRLLTFLQEPAARVGMKIAEAKRAVEVLAPLTINKGYALRRYVEEKGLRGVVFAGDDRTDLYAVRAIKQLQKENFAGHAIVVEQQDTLPELLAEADSIVQGVEGMVKKLAEIVSYLVRSE